MLLAARAGRRNRKNGGQTGPARVFEKDAGALCAPCFARPFGERPARRVRAGRVYAAKTSACGVLSAGLARDMLVRRSIMHRPRLSSPRTRGQCLLGAQALQVHSRSVRAARSNRATCVRAGTVVYVHASLAPSSHAGPRPPLRTATLTSLVCLQYLRLSDMSGR